MELCLLLSFILLWGVFEANIICLYDHKNSYCLFLLFKLFKNTESIHLKQSLPKNSDAIIQKTNQDDTTSTPTSIKVKTQKGMCVC